LGTPKDYSVCINKTFFYKGLKQLGSIVDCLKKLLASRGFRNALKKLDYNTVSMQRKEFFPPIFECDVVYELPPIRNSTGQLQTKLILGIDKQHNGHAKTKIITSHITNDIGLMFCTYHCMNHLCYDNQDYKYLTCIHHMLHVYETKWNGFSPAMFVAEYSFQMSLHFCANFFKYLHDL
jgi:hypothetical protein